MYTCAEAAMEITSTLKRYLFIYCEILTLGVSDTFDYQQVRGHSLLFPSFASHIPASRLLEEDLYYKTNTAISIIKYA